MKKSISLLTVFFFILACAPKENGTLDEIIKSNDLEKIKTYREKVHQDLEKITADLNRLDAAINDLDTEKNNPLVKVMVLKDTTFTHFIEITGNVDTRENIVITPEMNGVLTELFVKPGQKVSKGQLLARIDDGGLGAQLAQAETQLALAKTTFDRQKNLWEQKIGSEIQYLQAKTTLETQEKAVAQIRSQVERTSVKAPFDGTLEDVKVEKGQVVAPGIELMRIVNLRNMYISAQVPEAYLGQLKLNAIVDVSIASLGKIYKGKVRQIDNYINPNNRSFGIEIAVPNQENLLRPNQVAILRIEDYTNEKALLVPENIIQETADGSRTVFVVSEKDKNDEATTIRKIVKVGYTSGAYTEILSGLEAGEKVVTEGARSIREGVKVRILE